MRRKGAAELAAQKPAFGRRRAGTIKYLYLLESIEHPYRYCVPGRFGRAGVGASVGAFAAGAGAGVVTAGG